MKRILCITLILILACSSFALGAVTMTSINVSPNTAKIYVNGELLSADNFNYNGTLYVPLRAVSENMGADVNWNNSTKTATITSKEVNTTLSSGNAKTSNATPQNTSNININTTSSIAFPFHLYSADYKTYLGKCVTDEYDSDGIYNKYGTYGSEYSSKSIWNEYGTYGSKFSSESAFNDLATKPPVIVDNNGNFVGYLTSNKTKVNGYTISTLTYFLLEHNQ